MHMHTNERMARNDTSSPYAYKNKSDINSASLEHQCAQQEKKFHVPSVSGALLTLLDGIRQLMRLRLGYLRTTD